MPGLHPPIGCPVYAARQEHPSRNFACLLSLIHLQIRQEAVLFLTKIEKAEAKMGAHCAPEIGCFGYISATKYRSEAVCIRKEWQDMKTNYVAFVQAE